MPYDWAGNWIPDPPPAPAPQPQTPATPPERPWWLPRYDYFRYPPTVDGARLKQHLYDDVAAGGRCTSAETAKCADGSHVMRAIWTGTPHSQCLAGRARLGVTVLEEAEGEALWDASKLRPGPEYWGKAR